MSEPYVSVLLPIKNEEKNIQPCLLQIANQTYDKKKLEILIIDSNSQDNTKNIITSFKKNHILNIIVINDYNQHRSSSLNEGIKRATGEVILRVDARSRIPNDYIEKCVETLFKVDADNVGGIQKPIENEAVNLTQCAIGYAMSHSFGVGNAQFRLGKKSGYVDSVYLGCFRKTVFEKVGLFDDQSAIISEDSDLNYRIRKQGGKVYLNNNIIAYYYPRERLRDLARLYFCYGRARAKFILKWKDYTGYRQLVAPLFLLLLLALPLLSIFVPYCFYLWITIITTYILADGIVSLNIVKTRKKSWKMFFLLVVIFPIIHFTWGAGFWMRLLRK